METFTLDPRSWWFSVIFRRNPLIRSSDRIEAGVMIIALVVSLVAIPVAAIVGAMTYAARDHIYAQEVRERHAVIATVTDVGADDWGITPVHAKWSVATGECSGPLELTVAAKVGDRTTIWLDKDGNPVGAPTPTWQAVVDALAAVVLILLFVGGGLTLLVVGACWRLNRARDAQWERGITSFEEDGGRTNRH